MDVGKAEYLLLGVQNGAGTTEISVEAHQRPHDPPIPLTHIP